MQSFLSQAARLSNLGCKETSGSAPQRKTIFWLHSDLPRFSDSYAQNKITMWMRRLRLGRYFHRREQYANSVSHMKRTFGAQGKHRPMKSGLLWPTVTIELPLIRIRCPKASQTLVSSTIRKASLTSADITFIMSSTSPQKMRLRCVADGRESLCERV